MPTRLLLRLIALISLPAAAAPPPVKVFLLAGQSNMEGKAPNALFNHQATDPKTQDQFAHLRRDGDWIVRDDVFIKFLDRQGPLTLGYGSPDRTGVELEFGHAMGEMFPEPVILVKAAWGGHSLRKNFRPPSAGFPPEEDLNKELEQARARVTQENQKHGRTDPLPTLDSIKAAYGESYRQMLAEVRGVLADPATLEPSLAGSTAEIAGFVWFQGWNDQYGGAELEYAANLRHLINDVRRDLNAPALPIVVAAMGQNGSKPATGPMLVIQQAQLALNDDTDLKATVKAIPTDSLVDTAAETLYPTWKENFEQWKLTGGDHPYHYLGSALWFNRIGSAMATAMKELLPPPKKPADPSPPQ